MGDLDASRRTERLAELVAELTGAPPEEARAAVEGADARRRKALAVVAAAVDDLRRPLPSGMRMAGYVRGEGASAPEGSSPGGTELAG